MCDTPFRDQVVAVASARGLCACVERVLAKMSFRLSKAPRAPRIAAPRPSGRHIRVKVRHHVAAGRWLGAGRNAAA